VRFRANSKDPVSKDRVMRRILPFVLLTLYLVAPSFSENTQQNGVTPSLQEMLLLSLSSEDYPVTPGDTYQLAYFTAGSAVTTFTVVTSDYTANLGVLGNIDAEGLTFIDLKKQIEQRILRAYPDSSPSITIVSNGQFSVFVKGEVKSAGFYTAWGLTRLSQVIEHFLTSYSSTREMMIISKSGQTKKYDLFKAIRFGDRDQDPYVHPGDTIVVSKRDRAIRLSGAVRRGGIYQPLANEGLKELIEYYGDGFTELADRSRPTTENDYGKQ